MYGEGMHGRGACMAGGGHVWQGGVHGRGHAWQERWPLQQAVHILLECILVLLELFLNDLLNLANSVTKIFVMTVKGLEPTTSCVRDQDATTVPARHM